MSDNVKDWKQEKACKLAGDFMQEVPAYGRYEEDVGTLECMFLESMKEAEECGRRENHADELLEMVRELVQDHYKVCSWSHSRRGCNIPKKAQALIAKIKEKKDGGVRI